MKVKFIGRHGTRHGNTDFFPGEVYEVTSALGLPKQSFEFLDEPSEVKTETKSSSSKKKTKKK